MGEFLEFISTVLMEGSFHILFCTVFDLKTSKATIEPMNMKVRVGPNEEVMVRVVWKADKLAGLNTKKGRRIYAKHAVLNTFILSLGSLGCLS